MTTTPDIPVPSDDDEPGPAPAAEEPAGAEIGMSDGEPNTFEPEEDPDATA